MNNVHPSAAGGYQSGAGIYARSRPDYPEALLAWLDRALGLGPGRTCLDLGAGTGKFTRLLVRTGAEVTAVEPVAAMRDQLRAALPGLRVLEGAAQALPLPAGSVDAVACGQSFHWFAGPEALAEIHRVLRPGGRLGLVWNVRDESVDWVADLTAILAPYEGNTPRFRTGLWRRAFEGAPFTALEEVSLPHPHVGPPADVIVGRTLSVSFIARLPEAERSRVAAQVQALIDRHPELRGRETVAFPYLTRAFSCVRM
jgi:SAM-dependent methyltransferase